VHTNVGVVRLLPSSRWGRALLLVAAVIVVLFLAATARLFLWPQVDTPTHADAVVALGGDPGQHRAYKAIGLALDGYAPVALVSLGGEHPAPCPKAPARVRVMCFRANPLNTRGEAEYAARLAARNHWDKLIVVPERTQSTRARLLFGRCTAAKLYMVPVSDASTRLFLDVLYEWGALVKAAVLVRSC
jgi:hypothetical protein